MKLVYRDIFAKKHDQFVCKLKKTPSKLKLIHITWFYCFSKIYRRTSIYCSIQQVAPLSQRSFIRRSKNAGKFSFQSRKLLKPRR